jgi:hypothetical protein
MIFKVIDEKHIPKNSTIIAGTAQLIKYGPNRSSLKKWCNFPKH